MKLQLEVRAESSREYKTKTGATMTARSLIGLETGKDATLLNFVEVEVGDRDAHLCGKLAGKSITVAVSGIGESYGGRIRVKGDITVL